MRQYGVGMDTTDKDVDMHKRHGLGRPLSEQAMALAGRVLDRIRAEHVGAQLVASNDASGGELDGDATLGRHALTVTPATDGRRLDEERVGEGILAAKDGDGFV